MFLEIREIPKKKVISLEISDHQVFKLHCNSGGGVGDFPDSKVTFVFQVLAALRHRAVVVLKSRNFS